jgi:hypothetical protein
MNMRVRLIVLLVGVGFFTQSRLAPGEPAPAISYLLKVSGGQTFTDIGSDDKTTPVPVDPADLSRGLKVKFAVGDTVGDRAARVTNWKPFTELHMAVVKELVGTLDVDLTIESVEASATVSAVPREPVTGQSDPARLERIRAAKMPVIERPISFDKPEADALCSALEIFPPDNPWNTVIEDWPVHPNSRNIVASAGTGKPFRCNFDMAFILIPPNQKKVEVRLGEFASESDKGPYPVPDDTPIENWPIGYPGMTLPEVQRKEEKGDRHAIVVDPTNRMLYEFYQMRKTDSGWTASAAAIFDLKSNKLRPDGWTSTDAAGLPVFPAVVRYDELRRGIVEHAMRVTVTKTRRAYVYPATHYASRLTDENLPRMGERFRLRKDFDSSGFTPEVQAILKGLRKYGMIVADNGIDWAISVAPDRRIGNFAPELRKIKGSDFEVVEPPAGYRPPE